MRFSLCEWSRFSESFTEWNEGISFLQVKPMPPCTCAVFVSVYLSTKVVRTTCTHCTVGVYHKSRQLCVTCHKRDFPECGCCLSELWSQFCGTPGTLHTSNLFQNTSPATASVIGNLYQNWKKKDYMICICCPIAAFLFCHPLSMCKQLSHWRIAFLELILLKVVWISRHIHRKKIWMKYCNCVSCISIQATVE